jgi:hypothetical protein
MKVAFVPEHDQACIDKGGNDLGFIKTEDKGGRYRILAMNTDLGTAQTVDIVIKDQRPASTTQQPANALSIPNYGDSVAKPTG